MEDRKFVQVQIQSPSGEWVRVGMIALPTSASPGGFAYAEDYKGPPLCPDLDRANNGGRAFFPVRNPNPNLRGRYAHDLHPLFAEALPGPWGEHVMASHSASYGRASPGEKLWSLGTWRNGALRFESEGGENIEAFIDSYAALDAVRQKVDAFVARFAQTRVVPFALGNARQKWALSVNGGTSPKAAYLDENGVEQVVKFPREVIGSYAEGRVEGALLAVSERAGIDTVAHEQIPTKEGGAMLGTHRFDRLGEDDNDTSVYAHTISAAVALGVDARSPMDYTDIAEFIRKHSPQPQMDLESLFGRMLMNRLVGNTDDHLGQFVFISDYAGGWRLSPNFDVLVTEVESDGRLLPQSLKMLGTTEPSFSVPWVEHAAQSFGIPLSRALDVTARVAKAVTEFPEIARAYGVPESQLQGTLLPAMRLGTAERLASAAVIAKNNLQRGMGMT